MDFLNLTLTKTPYTLNFLPDIEGEIEPLVRHSENHDWFFLVITFVLFLIAFARTYAPRRFQMITGASYSLRRLTWLRDEGNVFFNPASAALFLVTVIVAALFAYGFHNYYIEAWPFEHEHDLLLVAHLAAVVALFRIVKDILILIIGKLFKSPVSSFLNLANQYVVNVVTALVLFTFVVFHFYLKEEFLLFIPLYVIVLVFIFRLIRSYIIGRKTEGFFPFYIILYLCTLEILPVLFLYKVIERFV
ncbi:MAG: DUF4271 domain-containing protein [Bacteroidota bacterium]